MTAISSDFGSVWVHPDAETLALQAALRCARDADEAAIFRAMLFGGAA